MVERLERRTEVLVKEGGNSRCHL